MTSSSLVGKIVLPGDTVLRLPEEGKVTRLAGGVQQAGADIVATQAGTFRHSKPNKHWVESSQKRYMPVAEDSVVGIVTQRFGENFQVDILAARPATLSGLAFEGATRRNRPQLQVGALVYARVISAHRDVDPEIACVDANDKASGYGPLTGGFNFEVTTGMARALLAHPTSPVLAALGKHLAYEIAIGQNGRVWVDSGDVQTTILVSNAITNARFLSGKQAEAMVEKLVQRILKG